MPHAPQFCAFTMRFTQKGPHCVVPCGQTHAPLVHEAPCGHELPHSVWPIAQLPPHTPFVHTCPIAHTVVQVPQWSGLVARSTHTPLHSVWPCGQLHLPLVQVVPPLHAMPQPPQFALSLVVS